MNQQSLEAQWAQIKNVIRDKWGDFADDDFASARGSAEKLFNMVQGKTGEDRSQVESHLNRAAPGNDFINNAKKMAVDYATSARESVVDVAQQASDQAKAGYEQTERVVRNKPMESLAVCFGVGLLAGVIGGLLLGSKDKSNDQS